MMDSQVLITTLKPITHYTQLFFGNVFGVSLQTLHKLTDGSGKDSFQVLSLQSELELAKGDYPRTRTYTSYV